MAVLPPAGADAHVEPLPQEGLMREDDFPTRPEELPDGSPQQLDALARQRRLRQEREQPPDELPPVA